MPNSELAVIFKQIADKDKSKMVSFRIGIIRVHCHSFKGLVLQGLQSLHKYTKTHPDTDMEPYLGKSSQYFRSYVKRNLDKLEEEEQEMRLNDIPDEIVQVINRNRNIQIY